MKYFDDDMDELFNKAGRQYPLKTEPKNWDDVQKALYPEQGTTVLEENNGYRKYLPLLLLLLIPAVYVFVDKENTKDKENSINKVTNTQPEMTNPYTENITKAGTARIDDKKSVHEENDLSYVPPPKGIPGSTRIEESGIVKGGLSGPQKAGQRGKDVSNRNMLTPASDIQEDPAVWNKIPSTDAGNVSVKDPSDVISLNTPVGSLIQTNGSASVPHSAKKNMSKNRFYYGVIAAPDISTVDGQEVRNIGYSVGVMTGYRFNHHWAIEAGALWSSKKYYTDGKYFDKTGANIPSNINIHWLDGGCNMFEFPIVARYNFSSKKKNTFFATAGLTSYMMRTEDYNYSADAGVGGSTYEGHRSYERSGDYLFSNMQLSAGYNINLSTKYHIRIEPYLKMPLKKIGIGNMPITSTGLYFGIMRDAR